MIVEYNGKKPQIARNVFIAPTAVLVGDVQVHEGASIWFGAVLRGDHGTITVGAGSNVRTTQRSMSPGMDARLSGRMSRLDTERCWKAAGSGRVPLSG
jgi:serine acetyltransferase